jgi:hypothetical protein
MVHVLMIADRVGKGTLSAVLDVYTDEQQAYQDLAALKEAEERHPRGFEFYIKSKVTVPKEPKWNP